MAWNTLTNLATGQLVTETHMDQIRENIEYLGGLTSYGTALSAIGAGGEIQDAVYDSGWFAVAASTAYTKAHGMSSIPTRLTIWYSTSASPADGDYRTVVGFGNVPFPATSVNDTNVYMYTDNLMSAGYFRVFAW